MSEKELNMKKKTCGNCTHYKGGFCIYGDPFEVKKDDVFCDDRFFELINCTNGDVIRQGGNEALIRYKNEHKCDICAYAAPLDHAPACRRPDGKTCRDGVLMWLNAPAESKTERKEQ